INQRVVTLVFSEFGRRVMETTGATAADAGTDHGAGGLMFAMGSRVRGGLAADWPGCEPSKLVPKIPPANPNQGNLSVPTDFRSVYQSVFTEWLGGDSPETVLGGPTPAALHRGDGQTGLFNPLT
ncbi:MAG: DUF1501 domain-containing protein, partial [Solirubrobacterales bacterium]